MSNELINESLQELGKLIQLMEEDADSLTASQAIGDYIAPILGSLLAEVEANRQYVANASTRAEFAILLNEKTFLGQIVETIAENFATVLEEMDMDSLDEESKIGVALVEIQDVLSAWVDLTSGEEDEDEDEDEDGDEDEDEDESGDEDAYHAQLVEEEYNEAIGHAADYLEEDAAGDVQDDKGAGPSDTEVLDAKS